MTARRHLSAWAALLAVLGSGCGVRPSGVITGGPAPTERVRGVTLYFLAGSSPEPVMRPARQPVLPAQVLAMLQQGPGGDERAAGLASEVPPGLGPVSVTPGAAGTVRVVVSADVTALSAAALDQIVCTVRDAVSATGPVTLTSAAGTRGPRLCPVAGAAPGREPGAPPLTE